MQRLLAQNKHFDFLTTVYSNLPPLSWVVEIAGREVKASCGRFVELFNEGLVEGCWDRPFNDYSFYKTTNFFGSGMIIDDDIVTFVTPTHTLESLYLLYGKDTLIVSNSLSFLLEYSKLDLPVSKNYGELFATLVRGIDKYEKLICTFGDVKLFRVAFTNVCWQSGRLTFSEKSEAPHFNKFSCYYNYLSTTLRDCFANAKSPHRSITFVPITTCSSGYDSTACAALVSSLGCEQALTLKTSHNGAEDSGKSVAEMLNLKVEECDRNQTTTPVEFPEAEFLATGMGGEDFAFCGFEKQLKQKLFLTGFHGDKIWDLDALPNTTISRGDISGSSLTEWRLRVGFIHLPVPFIGVTRHPDLHKISNSTDLKFFQINVKKYDRPIPRKIAEDMGVARAAFGQSKKAASNLFCHSLKAMSTESIEDLNSYWRQEFRGARLLHQKLRQHAFDARLNGMRFVLRLIRRIFNTQLPVFWRMQSIWMTHGEKLNNLLTRMIVGDYRVFEHSSPLKSDLPFLWAVKKIRKRYRLID